MRKLFIALIAALALVMVPACNDREGIKCKDGTTSYAKNRQGACSGHGGIA